MTPRELAAYSLDPVQFVRRGARKEPDPWQQRVIRNRAPRILLACSRQVGKSDCAAWVASHKAVTKKDSLILLVSPSDRQSGELFKKVDAILQELGIEREEDNKRSTILANGSRIVALPSSAQTIRGFPAVDLLVEDESAFCDDDLYAAVRPMLAVSGGQLMLLSSPFGKRGHFYREWTDPLAKWHRESVTADECPRISPVFLEEERRALGEWRYRQEYFCEFVETEDAVFTSGQIASFFDNDEGRIFSFQRAA